MSNVAINEDASDDKQGDWSKSLLPGKGDAVVDPDPGRPALEIFPAEIWTEIVHHLNSISQKEIARFRLVCKAWRDVIDEELKFRITLDDRKMDVTTLGHLNVKRCVIAHLLTKDFGKNPIFRDASKLQELFLWGPISLPNFQALMQQFSQITTLSLTDAPFKNEDLLKNVNPENYWTELKSLAISWNSSEEPSPAIFHLPVSHLERFRFSCHMDMINIMARWWDDTLSDPMFNLISRMVNLKKLDLQYYKCASQRNGAPTRFPIENLQRVQKLETVRLATNPFVLASWIPFLKLQTQLSDFRIISDRVMDDFTLSVDLLHELKSILIRNQNTLTCVEMKNYVLSQPLDCSVFQNMNLLKRLVLKRPVPTDCTLNEALALWPVHVTNLSLLPSSLETLSLTYLCCDSADLNVMTDRLDNIQSVKFEGIGHLVRSRLPRCVERENTGVTQQALDNLAGKRNLKDVLISPVFQEKINVVLKKEKNKFIKAGGVLIELLENTNLPWPYINFDFETARQEK